MWPVQAYRNGRRILVVAQLDNGGSNHIEMPVEVAEHLQGELACLVDEAKRAPTG